MYLKRENNYLINQINNEKIVSLITIAACIFQLNAQTIVLDCETSSSPISTSGSRGATDRINYDIANCWSFGGVSYTDISAINGSFSAQSGQSTNSSPTAFWIKSPWLKSGSVNITFNTK